MSTHLAWHDGKLYLGPVAIGRIHVLGESSDAASSGSWTWAINLPGAQVRNGKMESFERAIAEAEAAVDDWLSRTARNLR